MNTSEIEELKLGVEKLKKEKNAVVLAHNYQRPEVQDVGDFVGDSFGLAISAAKTKAKVIVFCGVDFMAESATVLNPDKVVVHPSRKAKCPMAAMVDVKRLRELKEKHPNAAVVSYVNTTVDVKAESTICCTSSNAVKVIKKLPHKKIIFIPDENLGRYVQRFIRDKKIILCPGFCPTHEVIDKNSVLRLRKLHPNAEVIVHPECTPETIEIADYVYSTEGMVNHVKKSQKKEFIIGTENGLSYKLSKESPGKTFYDMEYAICNQMKMITLQKVLQSLKTLAPRIKLSNKIINQAKEPLLRMMKIGRED